MEQSYWWKQVRLQWTEKVSDRLAYDNPREPLKLVHHNSLKRRQPSFSTNRIASICICLLCNRLIYRVQQSARWEYNTEHIIPGRKNSPTARSGKPGMREPNKNKGHKEPEPEGRTLNGITSVGPRLRFPSAHYREIRLQICTGKINYLFAGSPSPRDHPLPAPSHASSPSGVYLPA